MLVSDYKRRKKRKITANVEQIGIKNPNHKKLFLHFCSVGNDTTNDRALDELNSVACDEKYSKKIHEIISQGISDAIINENFTTAESLLEHVKTMKIKPFSCKQILLALFMVMKANANSIDAKDAVENIDKLDKKFMTKILSLETISSEYGKNLAKIASKTISTHGLLFCHHVLESMSSVNNSVWNNGYLIFKKVIDCFSDEDIISVITGEENKEYIIIFLDSEKISANTFRALYTEWISSLNCKCCQDYHWERRLEWYNTYKACKNTKTANTLEKIFILCDVVPDAYFDSVKCRKNFTRKIVQEIINNEETARNYFTITSYKTITDGLEEIVKFDHTSKLKFEKHRAEIIDSHATIIAEATGIYFDVAKIIVSLTFEFYSVKK